MKKILSLLIFCYSFLFSTPQYFLTFEEANAYAVTLVTGFNESYYFDNIPSNQSLDSTHPDSPFGVVPILFVVDVDNYVSFRRYYGHPYNVNPQIYGGVSYYPEHSFVPCTNGLVYNIETHQCSNPPPNCDPETEDLVNGQCVCKSGYNDSNNTTGTCYPDIACPVPPMVYTFTNVDWGIDSRTCVPDTNLTLAQCESNGFIYAKALDEDPNDPLSTYASVFGDGCITPDYAMNNIDNVLWHNFVGGLLPNMGVSASLLAQDLNRLFSSGKNLAKNINSFFTSSPLKPKLLTYKPNITDMQMGVDGVFYEIDAVPMNVSDVSQTTSNTQAYNQFLKDSGYITGIDNLPVAMDNIEFPTTAVNNFDDLFYRGSDSTDFTNTMLGSANIAKNGKVPNLNPLDSVPLNKQVETVTSINSNLNNTLVNDYPTYIVKTAKINLADRVESTYKGYIKYPDGSKTDLVIARTKFNVDGHTIDNVTTTIDIPTTSGIKKFSTNYQTYKDGSGTVTNIVNSPSSITTTTAGGTTTTTNTSTNSVTTSSTSPAVNLTPIIEKLNNIDSKIKTIIDTPIPPEISQATVKLTHFNASVDLFEVDFNSYKDFINGMINNINDLTTLFNDTKAILENKPTVTEITGVCGFSVVFITGQPAVFVDPCMFVAPYRPLLAIIFTLFGIFGVIGFSVKYLVSKGD